MNEGELVPGVGPLSDRREWDVATIKIEVPALPDFVAPLRSATRSASALADLAVDDIEELQIAVDEAATLLLPLVDPRGPRMLEARFQIGDGEVQISLAVYAVAGADVDRTGMAWIMLSALDPSVDVRSESDCVTIVITRVRSGRSQ